MALELVESAIDSLKAYLSVNMADTVASLNNEYNDGMTLHDMDDWYVAMIPDISSFPSGIILGNSGGPEGEGGGWLKSQHMIDIIVVATDQDAEILQRMQYRYIRALIVLCKSCRTTIGYQVNIAGWDFSENFYEGYSNVSGSKLSIILKKSENS